MSDEATGRVTASGWLRTHRLDLAAVAALLLLALGYYWPLTPGDRIAYDFDIWVYFYPLRQYAADALRAGRFPLWVPDVYLGAPFFANLQTALLYPLNVVYLLLPVPQGLTATAVLHTWLAGASMYLLARGPLRLSVGAALLSGLAFGFGGFITGLIGHINQLQASAWLPLLAWLLLTAFQRRSPRRVVAAGVVLALAVLAGHSQVVYLTLVALGIVALLAPWLNLAPPAAAADEVVPPRGRHATHWWQRLPWRGLAWSLGLYVLIAVLGLALAAAQLVPTAEAQREGIRGSGLGYADAASFSLPPTLLLEALLPGFWRNPFGEFIGYIGVIPLVLAVLALAAAPWRLALLGGALAGLGLFLAVGGYNPLYPLLYQVVPGLGLFRVPARWLFVYSFGAALLAGLGAEWAWQMAGVKGWWRLLDWRRVAVVVGLAVVAAALLLVTTGNLGARRFYFAWGGLGLLAVALTALTLWRPRIGLALLALATAAELVAASMPSAFRDAIPREVYRQVRPVLAPVLADGDRTRTLSLARDEYLLGELAAGRFPYPNAPERVIYNYAVAAKHNEVQTPNLALVYGLNTPDGYDGGVLPLQRWVDFMKLVVTEDEPRIDGVLRHRLHYLPDQRLLDLLGVRWVLTSTLREASWEGIPFDRLASQRLSQGGRFELAVPDVPAEALALLSSVADAAGLAADAPVGRITAVAASGATRELDIRLGQQTAAASEQLQLDAGLAAIQPPDGRLKNVDYVARLALGEPLTVQRLVFENVAPAGTWLVRAVTLLGAEGTPPRALPLTNSVTAVPQDDPSAVRLYRNAAPQPLAFLVPETVVADDATALDYLRGARFAPARTATVAPDAAARALDPTRAPAGAPADAVRIVERLPERWRLVTEAAGERLLVLTQAYYPGWRATIDGQPAPLVRANYLFQGLYVPAGAHTVELVYQPRSVAVGLLISLVALTAAVGLFVVGRLAWPARLRLTARGQAVPQRRRGRR